MKTYIIIIFLIFFSPIQIFSQTFSVGIGSGVNFVTGDNYYTHSLGRLGIYPDVNGTTVNLEGMGMRTEFQFQLSGKYSFKDSPFNLFADFNYLPMNGNENMNVWYWFAEEGIESTVTNKMDIWSFQLGANYYFTRSSIKPFISASISANYFSDTWIETDIDFYLTEYKSYENGMRYGYGVGLGAAYEISKYFDAELSGNFNSFNQLGRRDGEELLNSINVLLIVYYKFE